MGELTILRKLHSDLTISLSCLLCTNSSSSIRLGIRRDCQSTLQCLGTNGSRTGLLLKQGQSLVLIKKVGSDTGFIQAVHLLKGTLVVRISESGCLACQV